jgi:hypothetical protein
MEYVGAADWHFWMGVFYAYNGLGQEDMEFLAPTFNMDNQVTKDCLEAYKWGWALGLELTEDEYIELTTSPKDDIVEFIPVKVDKVKDEQDFETLIKIVGNC